MELSQFKTVEQLAAAIKSLDMVTSVAWTNYSSSSTVTGWSSFTVKQIYYKRVGDLVFVAYLLDGTSNSTSASFSLPVNSASGINSFEHKPSRAINNGSNLDGSAFGTLPASNNTITFYPTEAAGSWTASGTKRVRGQFWYET